MRSRLLRLRQFTSNQIIPPDELHCVPFTERRSTEKAFIDKWLNGNAACRFNGVESAYVSIF